MGIKKELGKVKEGRGFWGIAIAVTVAILLVVPGTMWLVGKLKEKFGKPAAA